MKKHDDLLLRVFKLIAKSYFTDHKMSPTYCTPIDFDRSLGEDVSDYIRSSNPEYYYSKEKEFSNKTLPKSEMDHIFIGRVSYRDEKGILCEPPVPYKGGLLSQPLPPLFSRDDLERTIHNILEEIYDDHSIGDENVAVKNIMEQVDKYFNDETERNT